MGKRKKHKKKKVDKAVRLSPREEDLIASIMDDIDSLTPENIKEKIPGPELARAVIERLPAQSTRDADLILAIGEVFNEKNVKKAVKKAVFRMKRKGIPIDEPKEHEESLLTMNTMQREEPTAFVGPVDGSGDRGVMVIIPQVPKGVDVGIGVVNHEKGLADFMSSRCSKRQMKEIRGFFFDQALGPVETTLSHFVTVLEKAYKNEHTVPGQAVDEYLKIRPWLLDNAAMLLQPPIYDHIKIDDIKGEVLTESLSQRLLGHELMESWIIDPEKIRPVMDDIDQAWDSPVLISDGQKSDRIKEIKENAIQEIFPEEKRIFYKDLLEEMSFIFLKLEQQEYARLALLAALSLEDSQSRLLPNIFLMSMLERTLLFFEDMMEQEDNIQDSTEESQSSIII